MCDQWTFVAIDSETKLVRYNRIVKRNLPTGRSFTTDLAAALKPRATFIRCVLAAYRLRRSGHSARIRLRAGGRFLRCEPVGLGCYSPPKVHLFRAEVIAGSARSSKCLIEHESGRIEMRNVNMSVCALTNAFSTKVENLHER